MKIIAEIAQGFEGNVELSQLLIRAAASAEADIVKFQLVYADELAVEKYQYYKLFKELELAQEEWEQIKSLADNLQVTLCFDVFGEKSLQVSEGLGVEIIKLHPTDINNFDLLEKVRSSQIKTVIIGSGGADEDEVDKVIEFFKNSKNIVLMHGFQGYPTNNSANQISRIGYFNNRYKSNNIELGFADHVVEDAPYSATLNAMAFCAGASYFEKHLSFGTVMKMEDYESSLSPDEFFKFSRNLKLAIEAYASVDNEDKHYGMTNEEKTYRNNIRRKVVTKREIKRGKIIESTDITLKRGDEDGFLEIETVVGKIAKKDIPKNQLIIKELITENR